MSEELEIDISPEGRVTVRTIGIKGPRCLDVAEAVARIIGVEEQRQLTREYYETESQVNTHLNVHQSWNRGYGMQ